MSAESKLLHWTIEESESYECASNRGHLQRVNPQYFHSEFIENLRECAEHSCFGEAQNYFPRDKGIYFCCRRSTGIWLDEIWYIGRSKNFRKRWQAHHKANALKSIKHIELFFWEMNIWSDNDIAMLERKYINMLQPAFNDVTVKTDDDLDIECLQAFTDGYRKAQQDASAHYSQEIMRLHSQIAELKGRFNP